MISSRTAKAGAALLFWALSTRVVVVQVTSFSLPSTAARNNAGTSMFATHDQARAKPTSNELLLTYLEVNGWMLTANGVTILIDPILEGPLDFGIPALYKASKRSLPASGLCEVLPNVDCLLLTQGLDDHAHARTLTKLAKLDPDIPIVAPPSAGKTLEQCGFTVDTSKHVRIVSPGDRTTISRRQTSEKEDKGSFGMEVKTTSGALVGPPWQARENGYILRSASNNNKTPSIYLEPHVEFDAEKLAQEAPVDVVITPIVGQGLPAFELVHGPQDALRLVKTLGAKIVVPMPNGDLDMAGVASGLVSRIGSQNEFRQGLQGTPWGTNVVLKDVAPGRPIVLKGE